MWRKLMQLVLLVTLALVGLCLLLMWQEPRMIYYPDRRPFTTPPGTTDLTLNTSDGETIHGWFAPAPTSTPLTVLFLHGNAGHLADRLEKIELLQALGVNVCIIDYRGYGRSTGTPSEHGTYRDAEAAFDWLVKQHRRVILYGESLGTGVAVELATRHPVDGVILEAGFTSIGDVAQGLYPFLPVRWLVRNRYESLAKISQFKAPLLIFHSRDDEVFPLRHGQRLYAAAPGPKHWVELRGGHNDAFAQSAKLYQAELKRFLAGLVAAPTSQ